MSFNVEDATILLLASPLGAAVHAADSAHAVAICRALVLDALATNPPPPGPQDALWAAFLDGWARLGAESGGRPSVTVRYALERLFTGPGQDSPGDDGWMGMRDVVRQLTGEPVPDARRLGLVLRGLRGRNVGGRMVAPDGHVEGRALWAVVPAPRVPALDAGAPLAGGSTPAVE